ncbi:hypothetical protein N7448_008420 [Penicillium atrosanguineum]|uniref:NmrA-like domain-containing protein n=1 Tax=Penicillium atrosanguineum TaxID=1132637 RepID=A0A9W9QBX8_9EURO|nr:uncharacterized protein N7443_000564 [Penicillium atrosanguineum]KAJ5127641.1 hypothetical protein N7448_008420 [Penicillium atrosanguineum]KAJ5147849.1 hypothetical protein N7526_001201 [Penicillium atrosanguineum]KAJ5313680.1 hypothetical protein N7443_000564 [Penicillium atrosanguineum]KAJ5330852.1 hypothetical protein N7476_000635 [Penicillium atrosanguineum]
MSTVIVFGPTGNIGSVAARTAQEHGAKVVLAMRDPKKAIPGLSVQQEQDGGFTKVQADMTDADSVAAAVKKSGAKRAFIYAAFGSPDHMKSTLEALKSAGIEFVVFLSSYTISGEPKDVDSGDLIPYIHAQVELNLDDVFGPENYVAVRPGGFATNMLRNKSDIAAGEVKLYTPNFELDCVTPIDMGRVSGTILAQGPKNGQRKVYVYGPQVISMSEAIHTIAKVLGKTVKITTINAEEAMEQHLSHGLPKPLAEYMIRRFGTDEDANVPRAHYEEGVQNVQLYTGAPSTGFQEWVTANKDLFSA